MWAAAIVPAIIVVAALISWGMRSAQYVEANRCIRSKPKVVTGGRIWHSSGFLGGGYTSYRLWYEGKTAVTDEDCKTSYLVTEAEYDRQMFGGD